MAWKAPLGVGMWLWAAGEVGVASEVRSHRTEEEPSKLSHLPFATLW